MKKIKFLLIAMMAMMTTMSFVACSDDDDVDVNSGSQYNFEKYQAAVNQTVKAENAATGNKKVVLLVAFGSTWQQAYDAFDETVKEYKRQFTGYDVFLSFSSAICINRAALGENVEPRNYYAPKYWLNAFAQEGVRYNEIVVQSLQVIPGEEYTRVISAMKDFQNNADGDLDDAYLASVNVKLGKPLMDNPDTDVPLLAQRLNALYGTKATNGYVLFMGHGNPDSYDTFKANVRYTQLEEALQALNPHFFVGTVDMMDNFKVQVMERMKQAGYTSGTVYCHPLMSIAGDHAHNDMGGDDDAWDNGYELNEDNEVEDTSWKNYFNNSGYTCNDDTQLMYGLLELPTVRDIWIQHTKNAEEFDYYNSMYPEE